MERSIFNDSSDERVKMAEIITLDWTVQHWIDMDNMFNHIQTHAQNTILVNFSALQTHEEKLSEQYKTTKTVSSRLKGYMHSGEDFFPNTKYPLIMIQDPDLEGDFTVQNALIESIAAESPQTFFIMIQTTKDLGCIQNSDNIYYIFLPKIVLKQNTLYKTNCVGEVASLVFFGELRFRGIFSHLWSNFHYNELENLNDRHFADIVQESLVSPFYLSPKISKNAIFMGFGYEEYKPQIVKRKLSPVRRKRLAVPSKSLKLKPTITSPPSPPRKPTITRPPSPPARKSTITELPSSPMRDSLISRLSPQQKSKVSLSLLGKKEPENTKIKEKGKAIVGKKTIVNPKTGRKIVVGGSTYLRLLEKGVIDEALEDTP